MLISKQKLSPHWVQSDLLKLLINAASAVWRPLLVPVFYPALTVMVVSVTEEWDYHISVTI